MLHAGMQPPRELDGALVIRWAEVTADVLATDRTRHVVDGEPKGPFAQLAIVRYPGDDGYHLFYLDTGGGVITDTYHDTLERAVEQADYEYIGLAWRSPDAE